MCDPESLKRNSSVSNKNKIYSIVTSPDRVKEMCNRVSDCELAFPLSFHSHVLRSFSESYKATFLQWTAFLDFVSLPAK